MLVSLILFIIGLVLLIKGADLLVDGASELAEDYGVSKWIIGVTIVAFGTSLPEFTVSVIAAVKGLGDIAVGDIIGSNIANIGLVLGLAALLLPIYVKERLVRKEIIFMMLASFLLLVLPFNIFGTAGAGTYVIGRLKGVILLVVFALFLYFVIKNASHQRRLHKKSRKETKVEARKSLKHLLMVMLGLAGTVYGAKLVVDSGVRIARHFGLSEAVIALTLIAIGTSLPELVTCVVAVFKNKAEVAVGNIVGSNIFNILWVGGTAAVVSPLIIAPRLVLDAFVMLLFSLGLLFAISSGKRIERWHGAVFFAGYVIYLAMLF